MTPRRPYKMGLRAERPGHATDNPPGYSAVRAGGRLPLAVLSGLSTKSDTEAHLASHTLVTRILHVSPYGPALSGRNGSWALTSFLAPSVVCAPLPSELPEAQRPGYRP